VTASPTPPFGGRAQLGAPIVPMNPSGRYLRHRVAAERAYRARRRAAWRNRMIVCLGLCLFYFAIGRDLVALVTAKKSAAQMEVQHEVRQFGDDLRNLAAGAKAPSSDRMSPVALTSGAALAEAASRESPDGALAPLLDRPVETYPGTR
jgi:hypothetical protein